MNAPRSRATRPTARSVALEVVRRVTDEGAYSNLTLRSTLGAAGLSARDAALASELAYGTLRRLLQIDEELARLVDRPLAEASPMARGALRLGAYQLRHTRIPPHAAVAETVALVPARQRGFVNAVLRRLAASEPEHPTREEASEPRSGLAPWAIRELGRLLPEPEVGGAADALAARASVVLRVNPCRASVEEVERRLAQTGVRIRRGTLHPGSLLLERGSPADLPGFAEGWFTVQDEASSFVVGAMDPQPGDRVLDACAGPGGKAAQAACLVGGGLLVAADVAEARARLVRATAERLGVRASVVVQDGRRPAVRGGFDRVLVDAPCSGIGSARRRPELLWRATRADVAALSRLQVGIVSAAADLLTPGGRLVYSVCTFPRAETDAVCDALLRRRPDLEPEPILGPDGPAERIRLWPHRHGCDAMFVAAFHKPAPGRR